MSEIKNCPFCGDEADLYFSGDGYGQRWHICCIDMKDHSDDENCLLSTIDHDFSFSTREKAIAAWNTRVDEDATREEI